MVGGRRAEVGAIKASGQALRSFTGYRLVGLEHRARPVVIEHERPENSWTSRLSAMSVNGLAVPTGPENGRYGARVLHMLTDVQG